MSIGRSDYVPPYYGAPNDRRFRMSETEIEWNTNGLAEGDLIQLRSKLSPIMLIGEQERFIPDAIYVRKEMCQVFTELTKDDRALTQILIGSPGVGKSVLLLVVALHRVLTTGIPAIFVRKTRAPLEFVTVFFMKNARWTATSRSKQLLGFCSRPMKKEMQREPTFPLC